MYVVVVGGRGDRRLHMFDPQHPLHSFVEGGRESCSSGATELEVEFCSGKVSVFWIDKVALWAAIKTTFKYSPNDGRNCILFRSIVDKDMTRLALWQILTLHCRARSIIFLAVTDDVTCTIVLSAFSCTTNSSENMRVRVYDVYGRASTLLVMHSFFLTVANRM